MCNMIRLDLNEVSFRQSLSAPWIFQDVKLSLCPGVYGLLGPNGSGKTTLLECIAGIKVVSKGDIQCTLGARKLRDKRFRERLGYVPQEFAFYEEMKVDKFMSYVARMKMIPDHLIPGRVAELLQHFGLTTYSQFVIETLSTGQRRRLSIAQAIINDPHVLLMDEPLEGLDMEERASVMWQLHELAKDSIVLIASHIVVEIEHWVEQILFIVNEHVLGPKSPQQWRWAVMNEAGAGDGNRAEFLMEQLPTLEDIYLNIYQSELSKWSESTGY